VNVAELQKAADQQRQAVEQGQRNEKTKRPKRFESAFKTVVVVDQAQDQAHLTTTEGDQRPSLIAEKNATDSHGLTWHQRMQRVC
jgi:hypothetical protein